MGIRCNSIAYLKVSPENQLCREPFHVRLVLYILLFALLETRALEHVVCYLFIGVKKLLLTLILT